MNILTGDVSQFFFFSYTDMVALNLPASINLKVHKAAFSYIGICISSLDNICLVQEKNKYNSFIYNGIQNFFMYNKIYKNFYLKK